MSRSTLAYAIPLLFLVCNEASALTISAVRGSVAHGTDVIIMGSGFGTKYPVEPYFYDDFEGGAIGTAVWGQKGAVGTSVWKMYAYAGGADTLYSSDGYRGKAAKRLSKMNDFRDGYIDGLNALQGYVSYRYKYTHTGSWTGSYLSINKIFRMASLQGSNPIYSGQPSLMLTYQPVSRWLYSILSTNSTESGSTTNTVSGSTMGSENLWQRIEGYMKLSSPAGAANGEYFLGTLNHHAAAKNKVTRQEGYTSLVNSFLLPFTSANGGNGPADTLTQWADDVYFDNTQARIELCSTPQWAAPEKHCDIQIPRKMWEDGSVQIRVNLGSFTPGQGAWLYVIDAAGNVNASGYPVAIQ
jgi:hypothetical protein